MKALLLYALLGSTLVLAGTPQRAKRLTRQYDADFEQWVELVQEAKGNEAQNAAWLKKPDPKVAGLEVWREIGRDLKEPWTLEYAAWLLINTPEAVVSQPGRRTSPAKVIRDAVVKHHIQSKKVGPYCIALTHVQDPKAQALLRDIEAQNPDPGVKGAAALAMSILQRRLGDDKKQMWHRQNNLRKAIKAPDLVVGKTTTHAIIQEELYRMENLTMGTVAPDFTGIKIDQKVSKLSDYRGKVVVLFFWHALMPAHDESLELLRKYQADFEGKEVVLLGVNMDSPVTLRKNIADGKTTWTNFSDANQRISKQFRIETWPFIYVLDRKQRIRHIGPPGAFVKIAVDDLIKNPKD